MKPKVKALILQNLFHELESCQLMMTYNPSQNIVERILLLKEALTEIERSLLVDPEYCAKCKTATLDFYCGDERERRRKL